MFGRIHPEVVFPVEPWRWLSFLHLGRDGYTSLRVASDPLARQSQLVFLNKSSYLTCSNEFLMMGIPLYGVWPAGSRSEQAGLLRMEQGHGAFRYPIFSYPE